MLPIDQGLSQPVLPGSSWIDSGDMLDFLLSDFSSSWPLAAPVMQSDPLPQPLPSSQQVGPGHFAMQQMSKLITDLSSSLTAEIESTGITSSFLDTCLHVFFEKFIPSFPVLHKSTFLVRESSHPLLLNIIALGSLFVGAKDALAKGEALWRLAHTAVATSWQALMATKGPRDDCNGVQLVLTALLGQTYAILSKNKNLRTTAQVFHGLGFSWARHCGMFDSNDFRDADVPDLNAPEHEKVEAWKTWAAKEVMKRAVLGHYILDGQISEFSGHPVCTRHVTNSFSMPAPEPVFDATTVDTWIFAMRLHPVQKTSFREVYISLFSGKESDPQGMPLKNFAVRVVLEGLQSLATEISTGHAVGTPSKMTIAKALTKLHNERLLHSEHTVENIELLVRYHTICLNLATPTTMLGHRICHLYSISQQLHQPLAPDPSFTLREWANSTDGLRALLHAIAIQDLVEKLPLGRSHAIHLPTAIFAVATIYTARCLTGLSKTLAPTVFLWQDVWNDDSSASLYTFFEGGQLDSECEPVVRNLMYDLNSLQITLSSISLRWGVSNDMDELLQKWIAVAESNKSLG
jgi:hypothetical protein